MNLLKRDNIQLEEISDYKIYPIADNETPKLSADRLEYTFMNGIYYKKVWNLSTIKEIYEDIHIIQNEDNISELGFNSVEIAEKFIDLIKNCKNKRISESFNKFMNCNSFYCEEYKDDKFCVSKKVKRRYINPLTKNGRIYDVSIKSREKIDNYVNMKVSKYAYINI